MKLSRVRHGEEKTECRRDMNRFGQETTFVLTSNPGMCSVVDYYKHSQLHHGWDDKYSRELGWVVEEIFVGSSHFFFFSRYFHFVKCFKRHGTSQCRSFFLFFFFGGALVRDTPFWLWGIWHGCHLLCKRKTERRFSSNLAGKIGMESAVPKPVKMEKVCGQQVGIYQLSLQNDLKMLQKIKCKGIIYFKRSHYFYLEKVKPSHHHMAKKTSDSNNIIQSRGFKHLRRNESGPNLLVKNNLLYFTIKLYM